MKPKGFTLIEVLVSIVVAGIVLSAVMTSYASLSQTSRKATLTRQLQKETHFALMRMEDKIRSLPIGYDQYEGSGHCIGESIGGGKKLCLGQDVALEFHADNGQLLFHKYLPGEDKSQPLFSGRTLVQEATFSVVPTKDPAQNLGDKSLQLQPRVELFLNVASRIEPDITLQIRTTLSSRLYQ